MRTSRTAPRRFLAPALLTAHFLVAAPGCLVVKGSSVEEEGTLVTQNTMTQVKHGETSEQWLVGALGEPTSRQCVSAENDPHRVEVLRYEHLRRKESGGTVFLIFAGGSEHEERSVAYFEVTDGIITRSWMEQ